MCMTTPLKQLFQQIRCYLSSQLRFIPSGMDLNFFEGDSKGRKENLPGEGFQPVGIIRGASQITRGYRAPRDFSEELPPSSTISSVHYGFK